MENTTKQPYEKPDFQVIDINIESPLLLASDPKVPIGKDVPVG